MDDRVKTTRRAANRRRDELLREMCQLIEKMASVASGTTRSDPPPPREKSLLWAFGLLLARCNEYKVDAFPARLRQCLDDLRQAQQHSNDVLRVANAIRELLRDTDVHSVLQRMDPCSNATYPLVHFFERLLAESAPKLRRARGAYFTPYPLVRYIVRSVDLLLRRELGITQGLLTERPELCIVDPACGSGAFLLGVLAHLGSALAARQAISRWMEFDRLTGIDVMPECCGAAELLVEQELCSANAMEEPGESWSAMCGNPLADVELSRELFAGRVPVIVGNPPYNNFGQQNRDHWILEQLDEYKRGLNEKKLNLNDDFIKFIRWAQYWVDRAGRGIVALVTNNTYLSGVTHRQMRASLAETFDHIYLLDLHGSSKRRESAPDGTPDENVFPIQQGVAIGLFVKTDGASRRCRVLHADLWGSRSAKLETLARTDVTSTSWSTLEAKSPLHFFVPRQHDDTAYDTWPRLDQIFQRYVSGVQTKRDKLFVGFTRDEIAARVKTFLDSAARGEFDPDVPEWLRSKVRGVDFDPQSVRPYMVAPFDVRWVYYEPRLLGRARHRLLRYLDADNVALVFMRQTTNPPPYDHFLVTNQLVSDRVFYSAHGAPFVAPLYLHDGQDRDVNLNLDFLRQMAQHLGVPYQPAEGSSGVSFNARDVLHWIYGAAHEDTYRDLYFAQLSIDFPRIPWPDDLGHFVELCAAGSRRVDEHLTLISTATNVRSATNAATDSIEIQPGYPRWESNRLALNSDFMWPEPVEADVWETRIGGYRVLQRWLKQRTGRALEPYDLEHLRGIIDALTVV